MIGRRHTV